MKKQLLIKKELHNLTIEETLEKFKPLCTKLVNRTFITSYEKEDLMQVASLALFRAYENYDITTSNDFLTLAYRYIKMDMTRLIRDNCNSKRDTTDISFVDLYSTLGGSSEAQTYLETIPDSNTNVEEEVINSEIICSLIGIMNEEEMKMLPVLMGNKTQLQYSKEVGISNEGARKRVNKLALKLRTRLEKVGA